MFDHDSTQAPGADPTSMPGARHQAIDHLLHLKRLRNDAELSRYIGVTAPTVSKIRAGKLGVSPAILLRLHQSFGIPVAELRQLLERG